MRGEVMGKAVSVLLVAVALAGCATVAQKKGDSARLAIADLNVALALYYSDTGRYPTQEEGLGVLLRPVAPGLSPYITRIPADPWGWPYRYRVVDNLPRIDSAGPDGTFGTADDATE